jgi:hypothetical protein
MKLTATIVFSLEARSLAEAGATLDELLTPASAHEDIDIRSVDLQTPSNALPVPLPHAVPPRASEPIGPHPLPGSG